MTIDDRTRERIRWHCRRGLLELDLMLNAFVDKYLADLAPSELATFSVLLERPDPVLFDLLMGHAEAEAADERDLVALVRSIALREDIRHTLTPVGAIPGANG